MALARFGWSWWDLAICVQSVRGKHTWEEGPLSGEEWKFETKWEAVCLRDWGTYFVNDQRYVVVDATNEKAG